MMSYLLGNDEYRDGIRLYFIRTLIINEFEEQITECLAWHYNKKVDIVRWKITMGNDPIFCFKTLERPISPIYRLRVNDENNTSDIKPVHILYKLPRDEKYEYRVRTVPFTRPGKEPELHKLNMSKVLLCYSYHYNSDTCILELYKLMKLSCIPYYVTR